MTYYIRMSLFTTTSVRKQMQQRFLAKRSFSNINRHFPVGASTILRVSEAGACYLEEMAPHDVITYIPIADRRARQKCPNCVPLDVMSICNTGYAYPQYVVPKVVHFHLQMQL
jgi:hypothetical protein